MSRLSSLNLSTNLYSQLLKPHRHLSIDMNGVMEKGGRGVKRVAIGDTSICHDNMPILEPVNSNPEAFTTIGFNDTGAIRPLMIEAVADTKNSRIDKNEDISEKTIDRDIKIKYDQAISLEGYSSKDLNDLLNSGIIEIPTKEYPNAYTNDLPVQMNSFGIPIKEEPIETDDISDIDFNHKLEKNSLTENDSLDDLSNSGSFKLDQNYALDVELEPEIQESPQNPYAELNQMVTVYRGLENMTESAVQRYRLRPQSSTDWLHEFAANKHREVYIGEHDAVPPVIKNVHDDALSISDKSHHDNSEFEFGTKNIDKTFDGLGSHKSEIDDNEIKVDDLDDGHLSYDLDQNFPDKSKVSRLIVLPMNREPSYRSFEMEEDSDIF